MDLTNIQNTASETKFTVELCTTQSSIGCTGVSDPSDYQSVYLQFGALQKLSVALFSLLDFPVPPIS